MGVMEYLHLLSFICTACQFVLVGLATCWGGGATDNEYY